VSDHDPIPIGSAEELRAIADPRNGDFPFDGAYVLTSDLDLSGVSDFRPIGKTNFYGDDDVFTGVFDGDGHAIRNLTTEDARNAGVFGLVGSDGVVKNVAVEDADVSATWSGGESAAALVGQNDGTVRNASATGVVDAPLTSGGLVGENRGTVEESTATVEVLSAGQRGGLVGRNEGTIRSSTASGDVGVGADSDERSGGLVALNTGTVVDSEASGDVDGRLGGGLVGRNTASGTIEGSSATGSVDGVDGQLSHVGGLVADNSGTVEQSRATGDVAGNDGPETPVGSVVGGLVSENDGGSVRESYATGDVTTKNEGGGLLGRNGGTVEDAYATGAVDAGVAGGIVGTNENGATIRRVYAAGAVDESGVDVGGVAGRNNGSITGAYWDRSDAGTGVDDPIGDRRAPTDLVSLTTEEMQGSTAEATMPALAFDDVWTTVEGEYPSLAAFRSGKASLGIERPRLVQRAENTRVSRSATWDVVVEDNVGDPTNGLSAYDVPITLVDGVTIESVEAVTFRDSFEVTAGGVGESSITVSASSQTDPRAGDITGTVLFRLRLDTPKYLSGFEDLSSETRIIAGNTLVDADGDEYEVAIGFKRGPGVVADAEFDDVPAADRVEDPPLAAGVSTATLFDLSGPDDVSLDDDVDVTVTRDGTTVGTCTVRAAAVERAVDGQPLLAQFAAERAIFSDGSYPVFDAEARPSGTVEISITPRDEDVSGDATQLSVGTSDSNAFQVGEVPPLRVGFVAVDDRNERGDLPYGLIGGSSEFSDKTRQAVYRETIDRGIEYASRVLPTERIVAYVHDVNDGVQAEATVEDAPVYEEPFVTEQIADQEAARSHLDEELDAGNVKPGAPNGMLLTASGGSVEAADADVESLEEFDVTIGIVPRNYLTTLDANTSAGNFIAGTHPSSDPQPRASAFVSATADRGDGTTIVHEAGHHFVGTPYDDTLAQDTEGEEPNPPAGRQESSDGHPHENVVSTKIAPSDGGLRPGSVKGSIASYMSYASRSKWADSLTTRRLINSDGAFDPTPPEPEKEDGSSTSLFAVAATTADGIEFLTRRVRRVDTATETGDEAGADVTVRGGDDAALATQTLPTKLRVDVQTLNGDPTGPTVAENLIVGDIDFPEETAEVEVSAPAPDGGGDDDGGDTVTTTTDTTDPVVADFTPGTPTVGDPVTFDARSSFSTDPDGAVERYEWDWTDDGEFETDTTESKTTHTYAAEGSYDVTLRVTDDDGTTATITRTVEVGVGGGGDGEESTDSPGITVADFVAETQGVEQGDVPEGVVDRINDALEGTNPELYGASEGDGGDGGTGDT
jgi:hypothetical protein